MMEKITSYKGFNKDMTCRDFQYKEGEIYEEPSAKACERGFHAASIRWIVLIIIHRMRAYTMLWNRVAK